MPLKKLDAKKTFKWLKSIETKNGPSFMCQMLSYGYDITGFEVQIHFLYIFIADIIIPFINLGRSHSS